MQTAFTSSTATAGQHSSEGRIDNHTHGNQSRNNQLVPVGKRASDLGVLESKLESKLSLHPILDRPILNQQSNVLFDWIVLK